MWYTRLPRPQVPAYALHQVLWGYFPEVPDGDPRPFTYRVEGDDVLMLSRLKPACPALDISGRIGAGRVYQFDVLASPMNGYKVKSSKTSGRKVIEGNERRREWLARRLAGAELTFAQLFDREDLRFKRPSGAQVWVARCVARGTLQVTDRAEFVETMLRGVGGRGCWGCGMLVPPEVMLWSH
jgi:CRISPR-associated protein Cas6/Cse3/CasE subtype I-E